MPTMAEEPHWALLRTDTAGHSTALLSTKPVGKDSPSTSLSNMVCIGVTTEISTIPNEKQP